MPNRIKSLFLLVRFMSVLQELSIQISNERGGATVCKFNLREVIKLLLEIVGSTIMGGVLAYTLMDKQSVSDASKIQRIARNCGLQVKEDGKTHTIQLIRRTKHPWGAEYAYRIPLGLSFEDFQAKKQNIEDGLNHKRGLLDITLDDWKTLKLRADILEQIKKLLAGTKHRKEILLDYDGMLIIRTYKEPLTELIPFDDATLSKCKGWNVCVGTSRESTIYHDFDKIPHMVVAGTTRYGKSVFLKNVITTIIHSKPANVRFTLIDLKGGLAFNRFASLSQVDWVAKDVPESLQALREIKQEMQEKQREFLSKGFEDVKEAKSKQRRFIIVDEAAEMASTGETDREIKKMKIECETIVSEIARIGGGLGYRLVFATQYPTGDTLPRQVKQNCDARLCFRLPTDTASRVVLDESGAEALPLIKGRAIYRTDRKHILQTPFIENEYIDKTIKPHIIFKARKEPNHDRAKDSTGGSHTLIIEQT
jgi:S-DNA-T family DNA segregation ATPase FtsK/SpoIIIE